MSAAFNAGTRIDRDEYRTVEWPRCVSEKQTETTGRLVVALRRHLNSSDVVFAGNPDDADGQDEKSGARRRSNAIGRALGCFNQLWAYGYNDIDLVFDRVATRRDIAYSFRS